MKRLTFSLTALALSLTLVAASLVPAQAHRRDRALIGLAVGVLGATLANQRYRGYRYRRGRPRAFYAPYRYRNRSYRNRYYRNRHYRNRYYRNRYYRDRYYQPRYRYRSPYPSWDRNGRGSSPESDSR